MPPSASNMALTPAEVAPRRTETERPGGAGGGGRARGGGGGGGRGGAAGGREGAGPVRAVGGNLQPVASRRESAQRVTARRVRNGDGRLTSASNRRRLDADARGGRSRRTRGNRSGYP